MGTKAMQIERGKEVASATRRWLSWVAYPGVISLTLALHHLCLAQGLPVLASSYLAILVGALMVTGLELTMPHFARWRPDAREVKTDALFMLIVQMVLPVFLGLGVSLVLLDGRASLGLLRFPLWPHSLPVAVQMILMLLVADFLRYWLHVAAHRYEPLWRLHAVHHSPHRLYWLNVGRFHPLEKGLQYLFDALPFVLLGVDAQVLALYTVFYGVNGFFQHSNIELRFGLLNYVVSSAELHRWHHSLVASESNNNYGNNLIIWDVLFGTRFLPKDRVIETIGLPNPSYPLGFAAQLKTPFVAGIEVETRPLPRWRDLGLNLLLWLRWVGLRVLVWPSFRAALDHPRRAQISRLREILTANRDTIFGQRHGFADIASYEQFRQKVPIQDYESLRPWIEQQDRTGSPELTEERPTLYARTSGTTGAPKDIPIVASSIRDHRRCLDLLFVGQYGVRGAYAGKILALTSPSVEGRRESGSPYGSASGHIYRGLPALMRAKYVVPWQVFGLDDYDTKYATILRLALATRDITHIATANPSTLTRLLRLFVESRESLLAELSTGAFRLPDGVTREIATAVAPLLAVGQERRRELESILRSDSPTVAALWPGLRLLSTWTGGSCGIALETVRGSLPEGTCVADVGYFASELVGSITVDFAANLAVPSLQQNFFEFVERESWESGEPEFLTLDRLELGRDYYVIVTTSSGLYRYFMNDIVRVTGLYRETPTIQFLQKGRGVTSITGEKLYESQVIESVGRAASELGIEPTFYLMLADAEAARYTLVIELSPAGSADALAGAVDRELSVANLEYSQKRASGRLAPLTVVFLGLGAGDAYKRFGLAAGQREGQWKTVALQSKADLLFDYEAFDLSRGGFK